jgi:cyclomaltodextrinase / maltogenic alpha-amylase / neopullulanase
MDKQTILRARALRPDAPYHLPPPAQPLRSTVTLILENAPAQPEIVLQDRYRDVTWRVQMRDTAGTYEADILLPLEPTVVSYHFEFADGSVLQERRQLDHVIGPKFARKKRYEEREFQIAVYDPYSMPADWTQGMVIYQIFPDRFARGKTEITYPQYGPYGYEVLKKEWTESPEIPPLGRDFFGGDIRGIIQKLDYLRDLGVNCIYLCPIFDAPTNHRYDTRDYSKIDAMLGTREDMVELIAKVHDRGMKIILDAVFNHCSCDSIYFDKPGLYNGAYQDKQSPYYRWFTFTDWPEKFKTWKGNQTLPEFVECPEVEDFFLGPEGITCQWIQAGIDGWRTDATWSNTEAFWRHFRTAENTLRPDGYLVCEEWENASHYLVGDMFSAATNYRFAWALRGFFAYDSLTVSQFDDRLATLRRDTPAPALLSQLNLIDSHDTTRALTICGDDKRRFMQMVAFQMSYPGAPLIYYGDEAGLRSETDESGRNPFETGESGRKPFPWGAEDADILRFYRKLTATRQRLAALRVGTFETLVVDDKNRLYAFSRRTGRDTVYACFNVNDHQAEISIPLSDDVSGNWTDALGSIDAHATSVGNVLKVLLQPRGFAWLVPA